MQLRNSQLDNFSTVLSMLYDAQLSHSKPANKVRQTWNGKVHKVEYPLFSPWPTSTQRHPKTSSGTFAFTNRWGIDRRCGEVRMLHDSDHQRQLAKWRGSLDQRCLRENINLYLREGALRTHCL